MKKIVFAENGDVLDEESGKVVGHRDANGRVILNQVTSTEKKEENQIENNSEKILSKPSIVGEKIVSFSKYEVRPDSEFVIRFCIGDSDGRIQLYREDAKTKNPALEEHWVKFRMWTYKEELEWRNKCMEFEPTMRAFHLKIDKFNELKLRRLIKSWSFEEYDSKFKLLHVDGVLSDESYEILKGLYPVIVNNIIHLMNRVLEGNG